MQDKYGETVKFDRDLNIAFDPALIDFLKVYNPSIKKFDSCEHWGWNNEGEENLPFHDFGRIADFHFNIYKDKTVLYYGDGPHYGYFKSEPTRFILLPVGAIPTKGFIPTGSLSFVKEFPFPKTMFDLAAHIDGFFAYRFKHIWELKTAYKERFSSAKNNLPEDNDLPF